MLFADFVYSREKTHANVTVTVVRDRKMRTALRTNQIAEFVTVTAWKKIIQFILLIVEENWGTCNDCETSQKVGAPSDQVSAH